MKSSTTGAPWSVVATTGLAPVAWGTTYVTITELLPPGRPLLVAAMRVLPAGAALVAVAGRRWRPHGVEWGYTTLLAVFNFGLFFPLLAVAVYRMPGGVAAAIGGIQPLVVAVISRALLDQRLTGRVVVTGLAAMVGVSLVVLRPGAEIDVVGVVAAVAANVAFATGLVLTKRFPPPADRLAGAGWQLLLGAVALVPLALVVEGRPPALDGRGLAGFTYLSLVATAGAFVVWFNGIRRLGTAVPPVLGLAAPVTGALIGWTVLGESLTVVQLLGFVIIAAAIARTASAAQRGTDTPARTHDARARRTCRVANRAGVRPLRIAPFGAEFRDV